MSELDEYIVNPQNGDDGIAEDGVSNADSGLGEMLDDPTVSLTSSVEAVSYENGRTYNGYYEGKYPLSRDEKEMCRLDTLRDVHSRLGDTYPLLYRAPLTQECPPTRILDLGTGTGIWALDVADTFPKTTVVSTDISPIQPKFVSPNCQFVIDDIELDWTYGSEEHFDFIHGRDLSGSLQNFPRLMRQAMQNLTPNGYFEIQELEICIYSDHSMENREWITTWQKLLHEASVNFGKPLRTAEHLKIWMAAAGFVDVHHEIQKIPIGTWAKGKKLKEIGRHFLAQLDDAVESYTLALYTRVLGWTRKKAEIMIELVRQQLHSKEARGNYLYVKFHFVYGRKPSENEGNKSMGIE